MAKSSDAEEQPVAGVVMTEAEGAAGDAESAILEPKLDPELEKYMAIVRQQREKEKQVCWFSVNCLGYFERLNRSIAMNWRKP